MYLGWKVASDQGCEEDVVHRMNEGYRVWGALKSVLSNRGLGIKAKKCIYQHIRTCTKFIQFRSYLYEVHLRNCTNAVVRRRDMEYEKC